MMLVERGSAVRAVSVAMLALLLAGCEGAVTVDLGADAPANPEIAQVMVNIVGVEFERSDGNTTQLEFSDSVATDFVDLLDGNTVRLFTDESLSEGTYTGVRLLLEEGDNTGVTLNDGTELPLVIEEGDYVEVDFSVDENESSQESLTLTVDLRQSLSFDDNDDEYTLSPVLRSVRTDEAGLIEGTISTRCPGNTSMLDGGAVYLFAGEDVDPDDVDGQGAEPYATVSVLAEVFSGQFDYALRFLPAGEYTIALTCDGEEDDPASNDSIDFIRTANVTVDEAETTVHDFEN